MQLKGKTAFITGGGGGIGGGIAHALAEKGMRLIIADINLNRALETAAPFGERAVAVKLDVTSLDGWKLARDAAIACFGEVDVLCNNAGIAHPRQPLDQMNPKLFAKVMAINVTGVYNGIVTFAGDMRARGLGHIVNTSSANGLMPFGSFTAYSASKFAVLALSDGLREELATHGVGVSTLFPGLTRSLMSEATKAELKLTGEQAEAFDANMMEPIWLGRAVARAIESNSPYIISHPGFRPAVEARHAAILAAFGEPAQPGYSPGASATQRAKQ